MADCPVRFLGAVAATACVIACAAASGATYYVAANGSDRGSGTSPARPWRTLARVNAAELKPGDRVLFRRGNAWRGLLRPHSGAPGNPIIYGAYGRGPKPTLLGSVSRSAAGDWHREGPSLWTTGGSPKQVPRRLPPVDEDERKVLWSLYTEGGARASGRRQEADDVPAAFRVKCEAPGLAPSDIQLIAGGMRIRQGQAYRLLLRLRSSAAFALTMPSLMQPESPWSSYSSGPELKSGETGPEWTVFAQYYRANTTTDNARVTIYLGGHLPAGATFEIDRLSFRGCPEAEVPPASMLPVDVGNLVFGNEESCGVKVWTKADLSSQGRFWYDPVARTLWLYSDRNPAARYKRIECALYRHIIDESGRAHVIYENLALRYGGAHGIGGGDTHHITVRDCDIAYIGGADQFGGGQRVRFGNGIEFWGDAHDNLVERCRLWEIYDAALTNQNMGRAGRQINITYRNNIIWNSEYSFEYWNRPAASETRNIRFIHNTCFDAGHGWSHAQRPDPSGRHLCFYSADAAASGILIANNIFCEATSNAFYAPTWPRNALVVLQMDSNVWCQRSGTMISVCGRAYRMDEFERYRREFGIEPRSITADPRFVDPGRRDFRLQRGSPCIGAGVDVGVTSDFDARPRPLRASPDIGALQRR